MARVYVSSTFVDLQECRKQVFLTLRRTRHEDVAMEYYVAGLQRPVETCLQDVAACDLYIGIFAWRYGWVPPDNNPEQRSVTEMEYREAVRTGKTCLIFLLHEDAPWPRKFIDRDPGRIEQVRNELSQKHLCSFFTSAQDIGAVVGPAIYEWAKKHGHIPAGTLIPELDLEAYFNALRKRYQRIDLEGLTPPQREEYLQLLLRSVFVEQNVRENPPPVELSKERWERLRREKEIHADDLPEGVMLDDLRKARDVYYEKPLRPVLDELTDLRQQYVVILGDPGSGKSTLSRYVLLSLIDPIGDEKLRRAFEGYLPLLIELRSYVGLYAENKCDTFLEFLEYLGETEGWHLNAVRLHEHLKNDGHAVVIFDGLDEIFDPEQREQVMRRIVGFATDYPKAHIIATSRIIGYRRKILTDADFAHFTLQDLDESQVATFAERWYELALSDRPEDARERRERILRAFRESHSIRQLAGNPMLLTIMAIIGKHQELPRERWKLYDHAANVLIEHWDINKHLRDQRVPAEFIGQDEKKEMLRRLAYRMQGGVGGLSGNYIHRDELQEEFENYLKGRFSQSPDRATAIARAMIQQFRERNFILSLYGANLYGFVHRAFLEYFCASAFVNRFEKTKELTLEDLKSDVYGIHWEDRNWHEVLRLICSMIDERWTGEIIDYLLAVPGQPQPEEYEKRLPWNIALAVQCLGELKNFSIVAEPAKGLLEAVCSLFDIRLNDRDAYDKFLGEQIAAFADAIGSNWPNKARLSIWLRQYQSFNLTGYYADAFGRFIGAIGAGLPEIRQIILEYAAHNDTELRFLASVTLPKGWQADPHTLPLLQDRMMNDEAWRVRIASVWAIGKYYPGDKQTLPLLRERVMGDENNDVRYAAVSVIVEHYREDEQTLLLLRDWAVNANYGNVRSAAAWAIGRYYQGDNQTLPLLRERALQDKNRNVRSAVVRAIAEHHRGDEQTLPLLRERAMEDESNDVRLAAVKVIVEHHRGDERTLSLLLDWAVNAPHSDVRLAAVKAIVEHHRGDEQTLPLLRERAMEDESNDVRLAAVKAIVEHYRGDERTLPLLLDWAVNAPHSDVRLAAMKAIAKHYQEDERTLPLLRKRALEDKNSNVRIEAVRAIAEHPRGDERTLPLLLDWAVNAPHSDARLAAMRAIVEHHRGDERTLPLLRERALEDKNSNVRLAAMKVIVKHYRGDERTLSLLLDWAVNALYSDVRLAAMKAIAEHHRGDERTLPLLLDWAVNAPHSDARLAAVKAIVEHHRGDERTLPLLLDWAVNALHSDVRYAAVRAIAEHYRGDEQTLPLLRERALEDKNSNVRIEAVRAIVEHYRGDERTLPLLLDWAVNVPYSDVRYTTVKAIAEHYGGDERALPLLLDWAVNALHSDVRYAAVRAIAEHYGGDEQTLPLLRERAVEDDPPLPGDLLWRIGMRLFAIEAIARHWPAHPDTLQLLRERAENDPAEGLRKRAKKLADQLAAKV